ncbi:cupin domain-containing protein [Streptacidiphilus anmyonensis]|uniref:cupin domain-containing protein n=1 Tax=Streptacidiphilus anmyonensis TaxID=405782 RepID=UPI0005A8FA77|nr:cupin domain-containing protein [Streptacidiphilus anmyonensis]
MGDRDRDRDRELIESLGLEPHPEGGYFRRIYTSPHPHAAAGGVRPTVTSIYYLTTAEQPCGRLHRNRSDILHFFLEGEPVEYHTVDPDGRLDVRVLGDGDARHLLVPGGWWKASRLPDGARYALVAEVVTPGFDFADHEFAREADLPPEHRDALRQFLA